MKLQYFPQNRHICKIASSASKSVYGGLYFRLNNLKYVKDPIPGIMLSLRCRPWNSQKLW